jgi:hypothetical protein
MREAIQCMYSCKLCGIVKRKITVPARSVEDVKAFLDGVARLVQTDHGIMSPECKATKIDELWIPMAGDGKPIGAA